MASQYNPNLLRQILGDISQGKNLGLPELVGEQRNTTLQNLLWNPVIAEKNAQQVMQQIKEGTYQEPEISNVQTFQYEEQKPVLTSDASLDTEKYYPTDIKRALAMGLLGLSGGTKPQEMALGFAKGFGQNILAQQQGNIQRNIYNELGLNIPEAVRAENIKDYVGQSFEVAKEKREQQKADLDNLETELKAQKLYIENSYLPEEKKAELKKKINDAEKSIYEAQKSKSDAKYANAINEANVSQKRASAALAGATIPLRQAQTKAAQSQLQAGTTSMGIPIKPLSNEAANGLANALQGIDSVGQLNQFIGQKDLYINPNKRFSYENYKDNVYDILARMRTGAAISKTEEQLYKRQIPSVEDMVLYPQQAKQKMATFNRLMTDKIKSIDPSGAYVYNLRGKTINQISKPRLTKQQAIQLAKQRGLIK